MSRLDNINKFLLLRITKYLQTHKEYTGNKYEQRLTIKVKTDAETALRLAEVSESMRRFVTSEMMPFWVAYYSSLINISKKSDHTLFCTNGRCKNLGHLVNRSRNRKYKDVMEKIRKVKEARTANKKL